MEFCKSTGLVITYEDDDQLKIIAIKRALMIAQIYHLELVKEEISIGKLIRIIELLPDLHTLSIDSLSIHQSKPFSAKELRKFSRTKNTTRIGKVCLLQMNSVNDIDFLMALFPAMTNFKIVQMKNMSIEFYLCHILKKINTDGHRSLRSLSFYHPTADDQLVKTLENMIVNENLLDNYSIKRVLSVICLQWK